MNYLSDKTVYLCGSIAAESDDGVGWRETITPTLNKYGLKILDPTRKTTEGVEEIGEDKDNFRRIARNEDWKELTRIFAPVARWDLRSVDKSDFIILNYDPRVPTVGTWHEVVIANIQKKPVLMKYDKTQIDKFNPWISVLIKYNNIFSEWELLFKRLTEVDNGIYDKKLWTL